MPDNEMQASLDSFLAKESEFKATTLRNNWANSAGTSPDDFAKQIALSRATGIPAQSLAADPEEAQRHAALQGTDFTGLVTTAPKTANFLLDQKNAGLYRDKTAELSVLERAMAGASYLGGSTVAGLHDLAGAGAKMLDAVNPFTLSDQDAAVLFKDQPEKLKQMREKSAAMGLSRFARGQTEASAKRMEAVSPEAKALYGGLKYETTDASTAAYLSPVKLISDALRSLPTSAALAATVILTRGAALKAEQAALTSGAEATVARQAGLSAATNMAVKFGAASEGSIGYAQQALQTQHDIEGMPIDKLRQAPEFQKLLDQGYDENVARIFTAARAGEQAGVGAGFVDALTNAIGGKFLGKIIGEGGNLIPRILKGFANEAGVEFVQSGGEQLFENIAKQANANPGQDLSENVIESMLQGLFVGGLTGGAFSGILGRAANETAVEGDAQHLADLFAAAAQVHDRDPETFKQFFQTIAPDATVLIDPDKLQEVLLQADIDPAKLPSFIEQANTSQAGAGIEIPVHELIAAFTGTGAEAALIPHVRFGADMPTLAESREAGTKAAEFFQKEADRILEEQSRNEEFVAGAKAVQDDIKAQLDSLGRFGPQATSGYAALTGAFYTTMASQLGVTPLQLRDGWTDAQGVARRGYKLTIGGEQNVNAAQSLNQLEPATRDTFTGAGIPNLLKTDNWTILTAENPNAQKLSPKENAARNAELQRYLTAQGYDFTPVKGHYGQPENSFVVTGISPEQAQALAKKFEQESVLTRHGLVYQDGSITPANGLTVHPSQPEDFYTTLPDGTHFTVGLDFEGPRKQLSEVLNQVSPEQARQTNVPVDLPTSQEFVDAVAGTPGAKITKDGLLIDLVRYQKQEQEGAKAIRTGVFYLPTGAATAKYYKKKGTMASGNEYGGAEEFKGETLVRHPLFVKGATGGKAPEVAYDTLKGKKAYDTMRTDVLHAVVGWGVAEAQKIENVKEMLARYGAEPGLAAEIVRNSRKGNLLPYAVQENIVAHAVRAAGYDAVVGYSKGKAGLNISEVFDVREQTFPARGLESDIHGAYLNQTARDFQTVTPAQIDAIRKEVAWTETGTENGFPVWKNAQVALTSPVDVTEGHDVFYKPLGNERAVKYQIQDANGRSVGYTVLELADGWPTLLLDIEVAETERGKRYAEQTVAAIANDAGELGIWHIVPSARSWWERIGAAPVDEHNGTIDFNGYADARASRENAQGLGRKLYQTAEVSKPGAVAGPVVGVHFSREKRGMLSSGAFGTGLTGAERERLQNSNDDRIKQRIAFYVSNGQGVFPEAGVGSAAHVATLTNLYDADADALKLFHSNKRDANAAESAVLDAGFDGYLQRNNFNNQGTVVLLGARSVSAPHVGGLAEANAQTAVPPPAEIPAMKAAAVALANDKTLPGGALTPAKWKEKLEARDPQLAAQIDFGMFKADEPIYKDQLSGALWQEADQWYYSQLRRSVEQAPAKIFATGASIKQWLLSNTGKLGIKKDEIEWTGITDWLDAQPKATKDDVLAFLDQGGVKVEEVMLGAAPDARAAGQALAESHGHVWADLGATSQRRYTQLAAGHTLVQPVAGETKFEQYVLPGGENYRELLLTLPVEQPEAIKLRNEIVAIQDKAFDEGRNMTLGEVERSNELRTQLNSAGNVMAQKKFRSSHFDQANILTHIRFNERTDAEGNRVLFVEEIQSDWGQKGKKEGFALENAASVARRQQEAKAKADTLLAGRSITQLTYDEMVEWNHWQGEATNSVAPPKGVPSAPFVKDTKAWTALAMKRVIAYAAENGFDKVAWTTGEQQAERYDLSKQIDNIKYFTNHLGQLQVFVEGKNGEDVWKSYDTSASDLEDVIGKELAKKIDDTASDETQHLTGLDLKVGGEGMKGFYDQIVPQVARDVLKKLGGGALETVGLPMTGYSDQGVRQGTNGGWEAFDLSASDEVVGRFATKKEAEQFMDVKPQPQPGFTITPEMRATVAQGLPLFAAKNGDKLGSFNPNTLDLRLLADANLSTFLHETGHFFLTVYADLASQPDAPAEITKGMAEILKQFGITGTETIFPTMQDREEGAALKDMAERMGITPRSLVEAWKVKAPKPNSEQGLLWEKLGGVPEVALFVAEGDPKQASRGRSALDVWGSMTLEQQRLYHEQFAESFEQYLFTGKAPSLELQPLFQRFASWLTRVYASIKDFIAGHEGAKLNPELAAVFDRMLATENEIAAANAARGFIALFKDAAEAGMSDKDFAAYTALSVDQKTDAEEMLRTRGLRDMKWLQNRRNKVIAELQADAKERRDAVLKDVSDEVAATPLRRAMRWLKRGEMTGADGAEIKALGGNKLQISELEEMFPEGALATPPDWKKLGYGQYGMLAAEGLSPDLVAEMFGITSGQELVSQLLGATKFADEVNALTDQRMLEQYGDLSSPDAISRAADEAIHNDARTRMVATELSALAKNVGAPSVLMKAAREYARQIIETKSSKTLKPWGFAAAETRAGKAALEALRKGDREKAAGEKRTELVNHVAAKEAYAAEKEIKKIVDRLKAIAAYKDDSSSVKTRDADIVNAVRAILADFGIGTKGKTAREYLAVVQANNPDLAAVLSDTIDAVTAEAKAWQELPLSKLRGLSEEINGLWFLAKRSKQVEIDGKLIPMREAQDAIHERLVEIGIPDHVPGEGSAVTAAEKRGILFDRFVGALRRVESWAGAKDGTLTGPFRKFMWNPVRDAADAYRADKVKYLKAYRDLLAPIAPTLTRQTISAPELDYVFGKDESGLGKAELLHAILHTGNESNKRKLLLGRGWATELMDKSLDTSKWDAFIERMENEGKITKADYDFAQGVWDLMEGMKPLAQKAHRDVFGRYFSEVSADALKTRFGDYRGGYVPALTDPLIVRDADLRALAETENSNMSFAFPATTKGFTKSRVESYAKPLKLDLRALSQHIDKVLLFSHMTRPVNDVRRMMSGKAVAQALGRVDPQAYNTLIIPWLNRAAKQVVETQTPGREGLGRFWSVVRGRAGMAAMFGNLANAVQQVTGLSLAAVRVRPALLLDAMAKYAMSPATFAEQVTGKSSYMATRLENEVSMMSDQINDILLNPTIYENAKSWTNRHAYFLQSAVDSVISPVVWLGGYNQAIEAGMSEADAIRAGDSAVRETQGSTAPEDIASFESGTAFYRMFVQFAGYFNMNANLLGTEYVKLTRDIGLRAGAGRGLYLLVLGFLAPAIVGELIMQAFKGGPDDDDKDGEYLDDWLMTLFAYAPARYLTAMVPGFGQVINAAANTLNNKPYDDRISTAPAISMIESAVKAPLSVYKAIAADGKPSRAIKDVATLISMSVGVPASAAARPISYLSDVAGDRVAPTGPVDLVRGTITGVATPASKQ